MKKFLSHTYNWEYFWLALIVIATVAMHVSIINQVKTPILDEVYYYGSVQGDNNINKGDAYYILNEHTDQRPEHPPLAKLIIAGGIVTLGDNPIGWRTPSIIFGTIGIILFYFICRRLKMSRTASSIATFIFGFENFSFMLASIAMLDVFYVTLMLAAFLLYLYRSYILSGVFIGLSALAKLYGALGAPVIFIHWLFTKTRQTRWFALTVFFAPVSFVALLPVFDYIIYRRFVNPIFAIKDMLSLSGSLTFANVTHPALSRPWSWILNYIPMPFWYTPHYTGAVSFTLWILIIPIVLYMIYKAFKRNDAGLFGFAWFFGVYLLWIPASIFTDRISFIYYFYPTIGALSLGLGLGLAQALDWASTRARRVRIPVRAGVFVFLGLHFLAFVILSPVFFRG